MLNNKTRACYTTCSFPHPQGGCGHHAHPDSALVTARPRKLTCCSKAACYSPCTSSWSASDCTPHR